MKAFTVAFSPLSLWKGAALNYSFTLREAIRSYNSKKCIFLWLSLKIKEAFSFLPCQG